METVIKGVGSIHTPQFRVHGKERRYLKKQLSLIKCSIKSLPRLVDCSEVYGDNYYTNDMMTELMLKKSIIEQTLEEPYENQ